MIGPKKPVWRNEAYRRYVASQECFSCRVEGYSQAAHPNFGKGMRTKTDDSLCFPLCSVRPGHMGCHQMHDLLIDMKLSERRERETHYSAEMMVRAKRDGWFKEAA